MQNVKWKFIENTNLKYIIVENGSVFSVTYGDFLKPEVKKGYYKYVKIKFDGNNKQTSIKVKKLLDRHFDNVTEKSYYMDLDKKEHDYKILKELKDKGYINIWGGQINEISRRIYQRFKTIAKTNQN